MPTRRDALRACLACAATAAVPRLARAALTPTELMGLYVIHLAQHPRLGSVGGSDAFSVPGATGDEHELVVTRTAMGTFAAVSAYCTHEGVLVNLFNASTQRISCPGHGAQFSATGTVLAGPARANLTRYTTAYDAAANLVTVNLSTFVATEAPAAAEGLALSVGPNPARGAVGVRVRLPEPMPARVAVYTATGALLAVLADGMADPRTTTVWHPGVAAPGVYVVRLSTPVGTRTAFVTRVR